MPVKNHHACALEINEIGILIKGHSGTGKTSLMLSLLERAKLENLNGLMIADDQVILKRDQNQLIANTPKSIAGLIELRGHGIIKKPYKPSCDIKLIVHILEDEKIDRMPEQKYYNFEDLDLPMVEVPQKHENQAVRIVFAWLKENASLQVD